MPDVEVTALWDGHDVWPAEYDAAFAAEERIPVVCRRLEDMPGQVDAAMLHGVNWDMHIEKALPFLRSGIPVLIDKPMVGSARDCDRLMEEQAKSGTLVYGGSSLRCAEEVVALRDQVGGREHLHSLLASGPGDFFSYGIHATEMLQGFVGTGIRSVQCLSNRGAPLFGVTFHDGFYALLQLQAAHYEWSLAASTDRGLRTAVVNPDTLYAPFLRTFIALLRGGDPGYALAGPVEAVRVHLAAEISRKTGQEVHLDRLPPDAGFDGAEFTRLYAAEKRRQAPQQ
jgi:predicted dehydrogenase